MQRLVVVVLVANVFAGCTLAAQGTGSTDNVTVGATSTNSAASTGAMATGSGGGGMGGTNTGGMGGNGGLGGAGGTIPGDWWDATFNHRVKITFNNTQSVPLSAFPVMIKLTPSRFDYAAAQPDGDDLRFVDDNGQTPLSHEVERWSVNGDSYVWVKVPKIEASSNIDFIWLYYGNTMAMNVQAPSDVWSANYISVYHLAGTQVQVADSLGAHNGNWDSGVVAPQVEGKMAEAIDLNGTQFINMGDVPDFDAVVPQARTIEAWFKASAAGSTDRWIVWEEANCVGWSLALTPSEKVRAPFLVGTSCGSFTYHVAETDETTFADNNWHHAAVVIDRPAGQMRLYVDGSFKKSTGVPNGGANGSEFRIGTNFNDSEPFVGQIDEVRISNIARDAPWIAAQVASMNDALASFGSTESL